MYLVIFTAYACKGILYLLLIAMVLRQFLPFFGKRPSLAERQIKHLTDPIVFAGGCICEMLGIPLDGEGIDFRYPIIELFLWICVIAVTVG